MRASELDVGATERVAVAHVDPERAAVAEPKVHDIVAREVVSVVECARRSLAARTPQRGGVCADGAETVWRQPREIERAEAAHRDPADRDAARIGTCAPERSRDHLPQHIRPPAAGAPVVPVARRAPVGDDDARRSPVESFQRRDEMRVRNVARIGAAAMQEDEQRRSPHARQCDLLVSRNLVADALVRVGMRAAARCKRKDGGCNLSRVTETTEPVTMDKIVSLCRRRGFVFPSSEIYGGLGSTYDYGHYGVLAKNNIRSLWFQAMVQERDDMVALDSAIILNPRVWEASGHVSGFTDPLVDCRTCKLRFRADKLEDAQCGRKPSKHPGEFSECDLTEARQFNLMFQTHVGALEGESSLAYLRPETAQGIFINFKNVLQIARRKPPFGIAQIGKSFRNEITPGNFLFRVREFEQMEMEFFVPPDDAERWYRYWIDERMSWYLKYGLRESRLRVREHSEEERSHYSRGTSDIEYLYPIGWSELEGVANRGDYDLAQHTEHSSTKLEYVGEGGERYTPWVIEPAVSIERILVALLVDAYDEEVVAERERTVLRLHPAIAPVKAAILPLVGKNDEMVARAKALQGELRRRHMVEYDDGGAIGRRYRRQDEIGTPFAFTIDEQTLEDDTVTVRDRDTLAQERLPLAGVPSWLDGALERPWKTPKPD
jgi:glycyl-tRNA synthetase